MINLPQYIFLTVVVGVVSYVHYNVAGTTVVDSMNQL